MDEWIATLDKAVLPPGPLDDDDYFELGGAEDTYFDDSFA